jgi:hypothetical protein
VVELEIYISMFYTVSLKKKNTDWMGRRVRMKLKIRYAVSNRTNQRRGIDTVSTKPVEVDR